MAPSYDVTLTRADGASGDTISVEAPDVVSAAARALELEPSEHDDWTAESVMKTDA